MQYLMSTGAKPMGVALLSVLCYLMAEATTAYEPPKIQLISRVRASLGKGVPLSVSCKAKPGFPDDFTLIYWLVNGTFVEKAYPNGTVWEGSEETYMENGKGFIQRDLKFEKIVHYDFATNYTCVVSSPTGIDKKMIQLNF